MMTPNRWACSTALPIRLSRPKNTRFIVPRGQPGPDEPHGASLPAARLFWSLQLTPASRAEQ